MASPISVSVCLCVSVSPGLHLSAPFVALTARTESSKQSKSWAKLERGLESLVLLFGQSADSSLVGGKTEKRREEGELLLLLLLLPFSGLALSACKMCQACAVGPVRAAASPPVCVCKCCCHFYCHCSLSVVSLAHCVSVLFVAFPLPVAASAASASVSASNAASSPSAATLVCSVQFNSIHYPILHYTTQFSSIQFSSAQFSSLLGAPNQPTNQTNLLLQTIPFYSPIEPNSIHQFASLQLAAYLQPTPIALCFWPPQQQQQQRQRQTNQTKSNQIVIIIITLYYNQAVKE